MLCGWLSPAGEMIYCSYWDHYDTACDICNKLNITYDNLPDEQLIELGWIKIFYSLFDISHILVYYKWGCRATDAQIQFLREDYEDEPDCWNLAIRDLKDLGVLDEEYDENGALI